MTVVVRTGPAGDTVPAASQRGTTRVTDRVITRVVGRAAGEAAGTTGRDRSVLGVRVGGRGEARARVAVDGDRVTARVSTSVEYPVPVRQVARRIRELVSARVFEMTGMTVERVDVEVASFDRADAAASGPRRLE
ncbi:Asp23/Gls24 family envelope stress response protein [Actinomadura oligospora]|uniref:Asp23/Gls24 family envelope stress response protein n=1 Tax=Actinomadura oligospora TaxID=111804 RepID=UPI0004AD2D37|nr:Asp23/Gls24 family envelope stress response protein [Actinomadura oligospora]